MTVEEYFDNIAEFWDSAYTHDIFARYTAAHMSQITSGCSVLDIGCGTGQMFPHLLAAGACEIVGVDISGRMVERAKEKYASDPRITLHNCSIAEFDEIGFDSALIYNAYTYFPEKHTLLEKVYSLLGAGGRFTVIQTRDSVGCEIPYFMEGSKAYTPLRPAADDAAVWANWFSVDCICDTSTLYAISGLRK